jgi:hypothetical protein
MIGVLQHGQVIGIVGGIAQHGDPGVVLGRRSQQRDPADVNVLDRLGPGGLGIGDGLLKRVQVHYRQIDDRPAAGAQRSPIFVIITRQQPGVDGRVQGLDATSQHLRLAGDPLHGCHHQPRGLQRLRGAPAGDQTPPRSRQPATEIHKASLVPDGKQSGFHNLFL